MKYFVKTPWWLKMIYPGRLWHVNTSEKALYLTFDDGPHPVATPFVLDELKKYNARATFFCIGKNVDKYPDIYKRILAEGHRVGNHTNNHLNGWKTANAAYLEDIAAAANKIKSGLFRPPYGRIRSSQAKRITSTLNDKYSKIVMWDVLSGDFDDKISGEECFSNATISTKEGSIIVFHDSEKAFLRLKDALPRTLHFFAEKKYSFFHL